jgi:methionine sulfoxide reductase heme-binding subunit
MGISERGARLASMRRVFKPVLFLAALMPLAWLAWGILHGTLGANPAETIQLQTGRWALKFLLITLAVTPVRRLTGWNVVIQYRRMFGLFAFFYASLHFTSYILLDQFFDWRAILRDIPKRPFILMGFSAFLLMVPLAITSTKGWIRRLGRRWQTLHRLIYVSAICAGIHFIWKVKVVSGDPVLYAAILTVLLGFRVLWRFRSTGLRRPARSRLTSP